MEPISLAAVTTYSLLDRVSKVETNKFAMPHIKGDGFSVFIDKLPGILKGKDFPALIEKIVSAYMSKKPVIFGMGAHVIKCGLSPIIIDLMKKGVITTVSLNGAGIIHDFEVALVGTTSEDVASALTDGSFGMAKETAEEINGAIITGAAKGWGIGRSVGERICSLQSPYQEYSILASAFKMEIPVTVHVAIGTDIIHQHPSASGAAIGEASMIDFRLLANQIKDMGDGGVFINIGSSVILPEVFLKALNVCRNLGHEVKDFTTANMDMINHYRPLTNVVTRPVLAGGSGYSFVGHHELMIPLLAAGIIEGIGCE
ncbi:hypothetical protein KKE26_06475 [bacterium]|nr:hypothetical protein [bacterium]MBU1753551.1 hypothetical protein [bacterium]